MQQTRKALLNDLKAKTELVLTEAKQLLTLSDERLKNRPASDKWNALECMEHLNLYGDFYLKEIEAQVLAAAPDKNATGFKSGFLGNKFALSLKPAKADKKLNSMKTFKDKNTLNQSLSKTSIERFMKQQERMLTLLKQAENVNLTKIKTAISISKLLKLRLGDTLRVVIYHNERHLVQAKKAAEVLLRLGKPDKMETTS